MLGDLSTFDATFATLALVLRFAAMCPFLSYLVISFYPPHNLIAFFVSGDSVSLLLHSNVAWLFVEYNKYNCPKLLHNCPN